LLKNKHRSHIVKTIIDLGIVSTTKRVCECIINSLNAELNTICFLLALLGAHHILHVSRIKVKNQSFVSLMRQP